MRALVRLAILLCISSSALAGEADAYNTHVQVTKATEKNHLAVVLIINKRLSSDISSGKLSIPKEAPTIPGDGAVFAFVIKQGETHSEVATHNANPDKKYFAAATVEPEGAGIWLKYATAVTKDGQLVFENSNQLLINKNVLLYP